MAEFDHDLESSGGNVPLGWTVVDSLPGFRPPLLLFLLLRVPWRTTPHIQQPNSKLYERVSGLFSRVHPWLPCMHYP